MQEEENDYFTFQTGRIKDNSLKSEIDWSTIKYNLDMQSNYIDLSTIKSNTDNSESPEKLPYYRKIVFLSGVSSFTYFNNIEDKRILLLGEYHLKSEKCMSLSKTSLEVQDYIYELAVNSPVCLDIFLEVPLYLKDDPIKYNSRYFPDINTNTKLGSSAYLSIYHKLSAFGHIFDPKYPRNKIRVHYIDARTWTKSNEMSSFFKITYELNINLYPHELIHVLKFNNLYKNDIFEYLVGIKENNIGKEKFREYFRFLIEKTYLKSGSDLSEHLFIEKYKEFVEDHEFIRNNFIKSVKKTVLKIKDFKYNLFINSLLKSYKKHKSMEEHFTILDIYNVIYMDVYFLLRYLSTYDVSKIRGPLNCRNSKESKYSIVAPGGHHTETYKHFFRFYYMKKPKVNLKDFMAPKRQCIIMDKPFDFFEGL